MCARSVPKPRLKPPWRNIGERYIKANPSPRYAAKKAALEDAQVRLSLELAEEAIAAEPENWTNRKQVGDVIWDTSEPGLALAYKIEDGEIIYLTFIDTYLA
jgi:hypothetical protein